MIHHWIPLWPTIHQQLIVVTECGNNDQSLAIASNALAIKAGELAITAKSPRPTYL
jgi:hypothetical protein